MIYGNPSAVEGRSPALHRGTSPPPETESVATADWTGGALILSKDIARPSHRTPLNMAILSTSRSHDKCLMLAVALAAVSLLPAAARAQRAPLPGQQSSGPVIQSTGQSFKVENPTFEIPSDHDFKAVFVIDAGGDSVRANAQLVTVARFFNINARHGFAEGAIHAAAVVHGGGWPDLLNDAAYAARFGGKANPSRKLIEELVQHGAQVVLCGQTAGARGIKRDELLPRVKVAISAMSALNYLQATGYRYNPW